MGRTLKENVRLLIAVPTMGGIHPILANRLIRWGQMYPGQISFYFTEHVAPVDRARNQIVEFFLKLRAEGTTPLTPARSSTLAAVPAFDRVAE